MSLIQDALNRANTPEPEPVVDKVLEEVKQAVEREPRLETIKFYETFTAPVEEELKKIKRNLPQASNKIQGIKTIYLSPNQLALIGMGILLLVSLIASRFMFRSTNDAAGLETHSVSAPAVSERSSRPVTVTTKSPVMQRTVAQVKFTLTGVTSSGETRLALINDQVVGVGDHLREKAVVKSIEETGATLDYEGRQVVLSL